MGKSLRRMLASFLALILVFLGANSAMALADVTPPVLSSVSLLSKKTVTVGDRVRIAWSATDASDV
ncbi:hypothetical protein LR392_14905, partial [Arthrobacter sp. AK04]|uniref:hypothetical protein n=1 Tax=Arthrobacter sp. AK04 TaxID=2900048 RepID=UPI001E623ADD